MDAIRTVSETDDVHVIEGRLAFGGPFAGRDTYRTFFSARTDWCLDLHPEGVPVLFNHGFDPEIGLKPIGRTVPTASFRTDADGVWVQMQLDKRKAYYNRVRLLLDEKGAGLSQGSAEHSVRFDERTGEVLLWPLQEISITPTESNPWNVIAARSAETARELIRIVDGSAVRAIQTFADIIAAAEMDDQLPEAFDTLRSAIYCAIWATDAEFNPVSPEEKRTAIQASLDQFRDYVISIMDRAARSGDPIPRGETAVRAAKRTPDQKRIDAIHDHATALGASAHADGPPNDESNQEPDTGESDAARSAEVLPTISIVERPDAAALRAHLLEAASKVGSQIGAEKATRLTT